MHKYSTLVYEACIESFCALPIAALVDGKFFCVHGGLSPLLLELNDIQYVCLFPVLTFLLLSTSDLRVTQMNRFQEPESQGLLCDLLWSDPIQAFGQEESNGIPAGSTFLHNSIRGCSYYYT